MNEAIKFGLKIAATAIIAVGLWVLVLICTKKANNIDHYNKKRDGE